MSHMQFVQERCVLDLYQENVARLCGLDLERTSQVVDLGEIDVSNIVGTVIVSDLAASPVDAFYLHRLAVLDGSGEWHCKV
jgi:hypothetical protein